MPKLRKVKDKEILKDFPNINHSPRLAHLFAGMSNDEIYKFRAQYPAICLIPTIGQERAFRHWDLKLSGYDDYYGTHILTSGNRFGKSIVLVLILCGVIKGKTYLNPDFMQLSFFDEFEKHRRSCNLTIWWCCESAFMAENGPNYKLIRELIPDAKFKSKTTSGWYREIHIPTHYIDADDDGNQVEQTNTIVVTVKTHEQPLTSFAGDCVHLVLCDEPLPQHLWGELTARTIMKVDDFGGYILIGGTPLKLAAYLSDVIDSDEVLHTEGSTWENCADIPEKEAKRLGVPKNNGKYVTRGVLSRKSIEKRIDSIVRSGDPTEIAARIDGKFGHTFGRKYKIFSRDAHVIEPWVELPKNYPVIQVVDPHDARPHAAGWYMITPRNQVVCIAEYPEKPFQNYTDQPENLEQTCDTWRMMEAEMGISNQIYTRIGDPNKFLCKDMFSHLTLVQQFARYGFDFDCYVNDNLTIGHSEVQKLLYYNAEKFDAFPTDRRFQPSLVFFNTCQNHISYLTKYGTKQVKDPSKPISEKPDEKWKDFADLVRYLAMKLEPYDDIMHRMNEGYDTYTAIMRGRTPGAVQQGVFA